MRLAHRKCVFFKTSEGLQAVISALTGGKFYRLPPDMENPVICSKLRQNLSEIEVRTFVRI